MQATQKAFDEFVYRPYASEYSTAHRNRQGDGHCLCLWRRLAVLVCFRMDSSALCGASRETTREEEGMMRTRVYTSADGGTIVADPTREEMEALMTRARGSNSGSRL